MNRSIQERIVFGIAGISSFILGLYIGYRYLGFVEDAGIPFLSLMWRPGHLDSLKATLMFLIIGCLVSVLVVMIVLNLLSLSYNSLTIAVKDASPNRNWMIYISSGKKAISGLWLTFMLFGVGSMLYSFYAQWNPHIGEFVSKDDFFLKFENIEAADKLDQYYDCSNVDVGMGWKFITLDYYISARNKTRPVSMVAGDLTDENGISYSRYYDDCLPKDEYYYRQEIPDNKFGKLVYRIPLNAVPGKISLFINSTQIEISLHKRQLL